MKKNHESMKLQLIKSLLILPFLFSLGCKTAVEPQKNQIFGEWRYVGTFDHRANYACYVCPAFNYETAKYRITFEEQGVLNTAINLMRGKGDYILVEIENNSNYKSWDFEIEDYIELNKPPETVENSIFRNKLLNGFVLGYVIDESSKYRSIQIQFNDNEYLYFVQER